MKTLLNNINYNYPSCGGYRIILGIKRIYIEIYSNYQGSITNRIISIYSQKNWSPEDYINGYENQTINNYPGYKIVKNGWIVN